MILQVGVKAFLKNSEGKYLLVKRSADKYKNTKGTWDIVGGRIDPGTKLLDNLRREVKEETQLDVVSDPVLIAAQDIIPNAEKHVVRLTYVASAQGQLILDMLENNEYEWLTIAEMKNKADLDVYVLDILRKGLIK
jgi:ADP-ribose pyrophosphatase YjhB (NUDIX family)